ncbi:uncharacterized protein isoform X2 [Musca autumnalis]|uniref:uncharacterized protein isoform X2 n=1 Tax=Musca autumnalis TaxID=221902 RepID=UPI003CF2E134
MCSDNMPENVQISGNNNPGSGVGIRPQGQHPNDGGVDGSAQMQNAPPNNQLIIQQMHQLAKKENPTNENHLQMLQLLKQNPQIMAAIIKQRQQSQNNATAGGQQGGGAAGADVGAADCPQQQLQEEQFQQGQVGAAGSKEMPGISGPGAGLRPQGQHPTNSGGVDGSEQMSNVPLNNQLNIQQLQQMMQKIKDSPTNESHLLILELLKKNPQIMTEIIKRRKQRENNANAGGQQGGCAGGNGSQEQQQ